VRSALLGGVRFYEHFVKPISLERLKAIIDRLLSEQMAQS
jgi:hypothetical protein